MSEQKGQIILVLILITTVVLAVVLSIVQKSLVDVSSSTKVEQSSRAFSAAEAGIERALKGDYSAPFPLENNSTIKNIVNFGLLPSVSVGTPQEPLEFNGPAKLAKEDIAQVWLADPAAALPICGAGFVCYAPTSNTLDIYWGNSNTDKAAIELTLIYHDGTQYKPKKWYLDHSVLRTPPNNFDQVACAGYLLGSNNYQCYVRIGHPTLDPVYSKNGPLPSGLMLIRARLLYNTTSQPFAVQAVGTCPNCYLPSQQRQILSEGASGDTQRAVQIIQSFNVVPHYFDYAIFSAGDISK